MPSLWNLYLLLPFSLPVSLHALALTGDNIQKTQQLDTDTAVQHLTQPSQTPHGSGLASVNPASGPQNAAFLSLRLSWPLSPSEDLDRQGVIGEYTDLQESTENPNEKAESAAEDTASKESVRLLKSSSAGQPPQPSTRYQPAETSAGSGLHSTQPGENPSFFSGSQDESSDSSLPLLLSGPLPSNGPDQNSKAPLFVGPWPSPRSTSPPVATSRWGWTPGPSVTTQGERKQGTVPATETEGVGAVTMETEKDSSSNDPRVSNASGKLLLDANMATSTTPCKTANQTWTPTDPADLTPRDSLRPSSSLSHVLFVPLYSDWNSALATWGFAWEAHIYGLGSIFTGFGLISVVCLLGLPLRCPPGSPYFTLLHLFLLAFAGIQAFCLLYDAYDHQERLPPLESLLLSELPFPCLISAFSLAFLLLTLRLRTHLSLPLAISTSFSLLPKPCLLLFLSMLHFVVSLGCAGMLQLFQSLPIMILLLPQGLFVCLTIFLSCSYLILYCLIQVNTKHIYRLNDSAESGGSPEVTGPASCPFAKGEDWDRAAGAGVGAALCLLGCGGLHLYGILHALGVGGVDGYGFHPWPWWGYQVACRICEVGVCLGICLIGTHPVFCHNYSSTKTHARPGSWSRLSCSSPTRGFTLPSHEGADSPVLTSHDSWSQSKQEKLVVCDVITKEQLEALPLCPMVDPPGNRVLCQDRTILPTPPSPPHKTKDTADSQLSSLDNWRLETDSTVDLRPPSPINLSRSIDQALFNESLFSHSIFGLPRLYNASSSLSLSSPNQNTSNHGPSSMENPLYRASSCGDVNQENHSTSRPPQPHGSLTSHGKSPEQWDWKESVSGSTQGLCSKPKLRSHSWANRGHSLAQSSLPRAIPHLSYHRRYRTLSLASQDSQGSGRLAGTKHLSESKQLEWDLAVQAEFVNVCRQIDALSVCSDTIEL